MAYSIHQIAERALREAGIDREYSGPFELINEAMSSSDFPNIVSNVQNKFLLDSYTYEGKYWAPLVKTRTVKDFKNIRSIRLTELGNLLQIPGERAEAPEFTFRAEETINYNVNLWGRRIEHLLSLLVDDDLNALQETTAAFGRSAARTIAADVMAPFTNMAMTYDVDGLVIFNVGAPHNNAQALALTAASLATAIALLKNQTDANGNRIKIGRFYLIVPPALEYTAWSLWEQQGGQIRRDIAPAVHRKMGMQEPIVCTDLATFSNTCWYLVADPNELKSIEVAYLRGLEEPAYLSGRGHWAQSLLGQYIGQNFTTEDACIHAWGYDVVDYRGLVQGNV